KIKYLILQQKNSFAIFPEPVRNHRSMASRNTSSLLYVGVQILKIEHEVLDEVEYQNNSVQTVYISRIQFPSVFYLRHKPRPKTTDDQWISCVHESDAYDLSPVDTPIKLHNSTVPTPYNA